MSETPSPPAENKSTEVAPTPNVEDQKVMALLAYLLWPVPMIVARDKPFVLFHLRQAAVLIAIMIPIVILSIIGGFLPGMVALGVSCVSMIVGIGVFIFAILGMINAWQGLEKPLPVVGQYADKMPF